MRPSRRTHPRVLFQSISHQVTPVEDTAMAVVVVMVVAKTGEPVVVPYLLQTSLLMKYHGC